MNRLILLLLVPFSGFYITKLPVSPIYLTFLASAYLFGIALLRNSRVRRSALSIYAFLFLMMTIFNGLLLGSTRSVSSFLSVFISITFFLMSYNVLKNCNASTIVVMGRRLVYYSLPLLIFEAYYRIANPIAYFEVTEARENIVFYFYKVNSIMYQDSNFVGIYVLSLFFFFKYLMDFSKKRLDKYVLLILVILCVVTISRASIISLLLFSILYPLRQKIYKFRSLILICVLLSSVLLFPVLESIKRLDGSFATKFHILDLAVEFLTKNDLITVLFGAGLGNSIDVIGMGAHNFFVTYLVEMGIVGLLVLLILWGLILVKSNYKSGIVMFPFLLNGLSFASHAIPYLYVMFAIILVLELRRKNEGRTNICYNSSI